MFHVFRKIAIWILGLPILTGAGKPAKGISPIRVERRAEPMEVVALVISVLGLVATLFAIGYELGKDIHDHHDKTQKQPPTSGKLSGYFLSIN